MDTHPMVQSNDTLTDCLNGTLITMNGNEVILQNDMGNRRVDKAFLPSGYEPVGMKEYGGVIYVAAYNPITNKSQIGSFPSPQKKLSSTNNGDLEGSFNFDDFFTNYNCDTDPDLRVNVINSDSFIIPLTKNINLRAGDKFAVYSEGLSGISSLLTNYDNTSGSNKAYSPKNRRFTLQLGVLNSQNEFVDITKTLCRWKNQNGTWSPVVYDEEKSDIFKFNDGYFISDSFTSQFNVDTIADAQLIKERQKIAANTYSYKLVGPLYLKIILNHIQNFNYNIYGLYDKDAGSATLWIEGFLTYNCPDGAPGLINNPNGDYATFEEGKPADNFGFDLFGFTSSNQVSMKTPSSYNVDRDKCVYNPNTNTYTVKIVRKYENITPSSITNKKFNYVIGVKADKDHNGVYIKGLSVKGTIDLSLLGSNQVKYSSWRFYNNQEEGSTLLTFAFEAYPEYGKSFGNLRFKFHNVFEGNNHNNDFWYPHDGGDLPMYNGRQTISFNWEENGFKERKIYEVTTEYNIINNKTKDIESTETINEGENSSRWLLTTGLFNEFYNQPIKTPDYCNVPKNTQDPVHQEFYNKMKVNFGNISSVINNSQLYRNLKSGTSLIATSENIDTSSTTQGANIKFIYENIYNLQINTDVQLGIIDKNLYPDYIGVDENVGKQNIKITNVSVTQIGEIENPSSDGTTSNEEMKYNSAFRHHLTTIKGLNATEGGVNSTVGMLEGEDLLLVDFDYNSKTVNGHIKFNDVYVGKGESISGIRNAFSNYSSLLNEGYCQPHNGEYEGLFANIVIEDYGTLTYKVVADVIRNYPNDTFPHVLYREHDKYPNSSGNEVYPVNDMNDLLNRIYDKNQRNTLSIEDFYASSTADKKHLGNAIPMSDVIEPLIGEFEDSRKDPTQVFMYIFIDNNYFSSSRQVDLGIGEVGYPYSDGVKRGSFNARVWWRTPSGQWALFADLFEKEEQGQSRYQKFSEFVKNYLGYDVIYCMYDEYTGNAGLYAATTNYAYYDKYSLPLSITISYGFPEGTNVEEMINNLISFDTNISCGNLKFVKQSEASFTQDIIDFDLSSSEIFYNSIRDFNTDDINNVYIGTGQTKDVNGESLKPNQFYYIDKDSNRLEKLLDPPFYIDFSHKTEDGRNILLYNKTNKGGAPIDPYDFYDLQWGIESNPWQLCIIPFDKNVNYVQPSSLRKASSARSQSQNY